MQHHLYRFGAVAAAGAATFGVLAAIAGVPAVAQSAPAVLVQPTPGKAALAKVQPKLAEVARRNKMPEQKLRETLADDKTSWLGTDGRLFFSEPGLSATQQTEATSPGWATSAVTSTGAVFQLHSRVGAKRVLYIDFDGQTLTGTAWNTGGKPATVKVGAYDTDGIPASYSTAEQNVIREVWQRVSEDYAPFEVDVTTQAPLASSITRSGTADLLYGTRVLVDSGTWYQTGCKCGGVAYNGAFDNATQHAYYQPALVFTKGVGTGAKNLAEVVAHEAGHTLGLSHDGTAAIGYYGGQGAWAPIMGMSYTRAITQWSRGEYSGANNKEDDFAVMARHGLALRADDHGNLPSTATALALGAVARGVYASDSDQDVFRIDLSAGTYTFAANANSGGNLDVRLQLLNSAGAVMASIAPADGQTSAATATGLSASVRKTVAKGRYYLRVDNTGFANPLTTGFSSYGSRGGYWVRVS